MHFYSRSKDDIITVTFFRNKHGGPKGKLLKCIIYVAHAAREHKIMLRIAQCFDWIPDFSISQGTNCCQTVITARIRRMGKVMFLQAPVYPQERVPQSVITGPLWGVRHSLIPGPFCGLPQSMVPGRFWGYSLWSQVPFGVPRIQGTPRQDMGTHVQD